MKNVKEQTLFLRNINFQLLKIQANLLLMLPIPITYEDWNFCHKIVNGDFE